MPKIKGPSKVRVGARIPNVLTVKLEALAGMDGTTLTAQVERALVEYVVRRKGDVQPKVKG